MSLPTYVLNLCSRLITNKIHLRNTHNMRKGPLEEMTINQVSLCGRVSGFPQMRNNVPQPYVIFPMVTETTRNTSFTKKTIIHNIKVNDPKLMNIIHTSLKPNKPVFVLGKLSMGEVKIGFKNCAVKVLIEAEEIIFNDK